MLSKEEVERLILSFARFYRKNDEVDKQRLSDIADLILSDRASEVGVEPEVMPNEVVGGGQWQKCPKCDGQGIVSKPPWIAGDQNTWADTQTSHTCNLCNGMMVIKQ